MASLKGFLLPAGLAASAVLRATPEAVITNISESTWALSLIHLQDSTDLPDFLTPGSEPMADVTFTINPLPRDPLREVKIPARPFGSFTLSQLKPGRYIEIPGHSELHLEAMSVTESCYVLFNLHDHSRCEEPEHDLCRDGLSSAIVVFTAVPEWAGDFARLSVVRTGYIPGLHDRPRDLDTYLWQDKRHPILGRDRLTILKDAYAIPTPCPLKETRVEIPSAPESGDPGTGEPAGAVPGCLSRWFRACLAGWF